MEAGGAGEVDGSEPVRMFLSSWFRCPSLSQLAYTIPLATWIHRCGPVGDTLSTYAGWQ